MDFNKEQLEKEELYIAQDEELANMYIKCRKLLRKINNLEEVDDFEKRNELYHNLLGKVGKNINIEPPFRCDYGKNIEVGDNFYANFDCLILDTGKVTIGNNVYFAPRVNIFTAAHPIDKDIRNENLEFSKKVIIGNDVWIGGNVTINPGVTIGNNVVIGSGSVITKDIPSNVIAFGNPCKVYREITDDDKKYWKKEKKKYLLAKEEYEKLK